MSMSFGNSDGKRPCEKHDLHLIWKRPCEPSEPSPRREYVDNKWYLLFEFASHEHSRQAHSGHIFMFVRGRSLTHRF